MLFEWDRDASNTNRHRYGVSFEQARSAFLDSNALLIDDPDGEGDGNYFILMGISRQLRKLLVCRCQRKADAVICILAARRATRPEFDQYCQQATL